MGDSQEMDEDLSEEQSKSPCLIKIFLLADQSA